LKIKYLGDENSSPVGRGNRHVFKNASEKFVVSIFRVKESKKILYHSTLSTFTEHFHPHLTFVM
jgi:hypothetical protein